MCKASWVILAETSTPVAFAFSDTATNLSGVTFNDVDFDAFELGGMVTWDPPSDTTQVTHYVVYFATDFQEPYFSYLEASKKKKLNRLFPSIMSPYPLAGIPHYHSFQNFIQFLCKIYLVCKIFMFNPFLKFN